jgi:aldehyde dehydrogenase (NAD+)
LLKYHIFNVQIRAKLGESFKTGKSKPISFRKEQLLHLAHGIKDNAGLLRKALASDIGRPEMEANFLEIGPSISETLEAFKSVTKWAKAESAPFTLNFGVMRGHVRKEPKGVVLIIV